MTSPYIHKVRYYECDRMGITHHSNYIRFMEEARIDLLDRLGYGFERMEADGVTSPVIGIEAAYKHPTTFQDEVAIEISVLEMSALKLSFGYTMRCRGQVVCTGRSTHCFLSGGKPLRLSDRYPALAEALQGMMA